MESPENRFCIICRKSHDLINVPMTIVNNKILFDACLKVFEIKEQTYKDNYKWKWDAKFDLPNFCTTCDKEIRILSEYTEDLSAIKKKIEDIVWHTKLEILKSTSAAKLNHSNRLSIRSFRYNTVSLTDAFDYFRSSAVKDWNPTVFISCFDQQASEVIELATEEQLLLTEEEWDQYMEDIGDKFQCKLCSTQISDRRNTARHINNAHRKIKRFQCSYCLKKFYDKADCLQHMKVNHKYESCKVRKSTNLQKIVTKEDGNFVQDKLKCLLCLKSLEETGIPVSPSVFASLCSAFGVASLKSLPCMEQLQEIPLMCESCHSQTVELHDFQEILNMNQSEGIVSEMILKIKTDILLSMSTNKQITENSRLTSNQVTATDKSEYFRKLIIQDYTPVVLIRDLQMICLSRRPEGRTRQIQHRTPTENSVFKYLNDDEILVINEDLTDKLIPLSAEEFEYYINCDDGKYKCRLCNSQPSTYKGAVNHCNKYHKNVKRFQCKYCDQQFYLRSDCGVHVLSSHKKERADVATEIQKRVEKSERCKSKSKDGVIELNHIKSDLKFSKEFILKEGKDKYRCALCPMVGIHRSSVRIHQNIVHLGLFRYKCEFCGYKQHHRFPVVKHVQKLHPEKLLNYSPPMKPPRKRIRIEPPSLLEGIIKLQVQEYPKVEDHFTGNGSDFNCNFCGRQFILRVKVVEHVECVHFGVRHYQCATCGMKWYSLNSCRKHMKKKHLNNLEGLNSEIHNSVGIDVEEQYFPPDTEKTLQGPCKEEPPDQISQENMPVSVQGHLLDTVEEEYDFENGEEIQVRIPKGELEINVMSYEEIEEDQFLMENGIEPDDVILRKNKCSTSVSLNEEPGPFPTPIAIHIKTEGEENEKIHSNNSTEKSEEFDEEMPVDKANIYNLIKPGEIIELPKNPNMITELKQGHKRLSNGYKCLKCHKVLKSLSVFNQHWGTVHDHLGGFQCSICQQRFYFKWKCALHFINQHTNRNPFVCPLCDKVFHNNRNLKMHVENHRGERPYACTLCTLKFTNEKTLQKHYDNVHPIVGS